MVTGDPEMARKINKALILDVIRNNENINRAEIARRLDISKVTVSTIVNELIESELVNEIGEGTSDENGGRKPILLSLNTSKKFVIGVDVGTTNTLAAFGNLKGQILEKVRVPTSRNRSVENIVEQVAYLIGDIIDQSGINRNKIVGICVSVAGIVEKSKGYIVFSPDFNWKNVYIAKLLQDKTNLTIIVDNCTRVMALGEIWYGKGKGLRTMFYINVGYGIGSALMIDSKIYSNNSEFGHSFITNRKVRCSCGNYGCIEALASGHAIERSANKIMKNRNKEWITAKMVANMVKNGDVEAEKIFDDAGRYLGRSISIIANTFNPDKIIIGGGVALAGNILLKPMIKEYNNHTMDAIKEKTQVCLSSLGIDAGVRGAIVLALNELVFKRDIIDHLSYYSFR